MAPLLHFLAILARFCSIASEVLIVVHRLAPLSILNLSDRCLAADFGLSVGGLSVRRATRLLPDLTNTGRPARPV